MNTGVWLQVSAKKFNKSFKTLPCLQYTNVEDLCKEYYEANPTKNV